MLTFPNQYSPHTPTERQREFLAAPELELFFGGAAGGGKSVALLMAALQYVDVPGYAALILRKDTHAARPGRRTDPAVARVAGELRSGEVECRPPPMVVSHRGAPATITFGYLATDGDKYRYASSEFQYIAFDELTELPEADYLFLFSRSAPGEVDRCAAADSLGQQPGQRRPRLGQASIRRAGERKA